MAHIISLAAGESALAQLNGNMASWQTTWVCTVRSVPIFCRQLCMIRLPERQMNPEGCEPAENPLIRMMPSRLTIPCSGMAMLY